MSLQLSRAVCPGGEDDLEGRDISEFVAPVYWHHVFFHETVLQLPFVTVTRIIMVYIYVHVVIYIILLLCVY